MRVLDPRPLRARRFGDGPDLVSVLTGAAIAASQKNILAGLAAVYDTLEIRTSVTPPALIDLRAAAYDTSGPSPVTQFLRPTLILSGRGGTEVLAPYGEAEGGWGPSIAALAVVVGVGFGLGWWARGSKR